MGQSYGTDTAMEEAGVVHGGDVRHGAHVLEGTMCPLVHRSLRLSR